MLSGFYSFFFSRVGLKRDISDNRTCSFIHLLNIFPSLNKQWKYLVVENVKGFEKSQACQQLIQTLEDLDFSYQQFISSPSMFSIPNTRHRYYIIAKRRPLYFNFPLQPHVVSILYNLCSIFYPLECHGISWIKFIMSSCNVCHFPLLLHQAYGQSGRWATLIW
jgi:tRNA (cytosine38-C5)-methyltransferase